MKILPYLLKSEEAANYFPASVQVCYCTHIPNLLIKFIVLGLFVMFNNFMKFISRSNRGNFQIWLLIRGMEITNDYQILAQYL